ncbi:MAG: hypothetical protein PHT91_00665 [Candidatus Nanoarchaeia archaeon]|nr:hypothetical protein [Candidatus Nanoarchaeia archaeon]
MSADFSVINLDYVMKLRNIENSYSPKEIISKKIECLEDLEGVGEKHASKIRDKGYSLTDVLKNPKLLYDSGICKANVDGIINMNKILQK